MFFSDIMDGWAEKITEWFAIAVRRVGFKIQKGEEDED